MTHEARRKAEYTKVKKELFKLLNDFMTNEEFQKNYPVLQRAIEIGSAKHLPLTEAFKLAEQEFSIK
jgi:hypothetical protein